MTIQGSIGALTVVDDQAGVGPLKVTRVKFVGDSAYAAGGSLGFRAALRAAFNGEKREILSVSPAGPNGDSHLEYTTCGKELPATVVASTDLFTAAGSGFSANDPVQFYADDVGNDNLPAPKLPAGIVAGTTYYVIASGLTATAFKVSATLGGAAVDVTDAGGQFQVQKQDLMLVRVMSTGTESATADQSGTTYGAVAISY